MTLEVGTNAWPLSIPLVLHEEIWPFESQAGPQEIVDRRGHAW